MKYYANLILVFGLLVIVILSGCKRDSSDAELSRSYYIFNRSPLKTIPYAQLPLGAIQPKGWLLEQLRYMREGMTGHLDELYEKVLGPRNGWLGGDGDGWERGPYWIDGLLPLAYILNDKELIAKVQPWIEWSIKNQTESGYFGPVPFETPPEREPGLQKDRRHDWWPKMVMLKVMQQYYMATGDERVIKLLTRYFQYQLKELPKTPLDHWSFWGNRRGGDNMMVVTWLYNVTGDDFLLDLAELIYEQTYPYTDMFLQGDILSNIRSFHCVNLAQGIKQPVIYYQHHPDQKYLDAVKKAFADIRKYHGQPQGMYGADESLHGKNPTQGSEFCSTIEMMVSLESMIQITGDVQFADHLERVAFNSLPTQANHDFTGRQYFQQPNQVLATAGSRNFFTDHEFDLVYGITTGYPCCTTNMHQGWPKFVQNLWYATIDSGLAAIHYSPSEVTAWVADGVKISIVEQTNYPFDETIRFELTNSKKVQFPLYLRIPAWCNKATVTINGELWEETSGNQILKIYREWKSGDVVELQLPMELTTDRWYENSASIERGPLVYALKIDENWKFVESEEYPPGYYEVYPESPWNYGLTLETVKNPSDFIIVTKKERIASQPWKADSAPIELKISGIRIPSWKLYNNMAGPLPVSERRNFDNQPEEEITLIPYGCTALRISEFPVISQ